MSNPAMSDGMYSGTEETLGALFATASRDLSALVRSEIELAKAELRQEVRTARRAGAMFGAAGFLSMLAVILLSIALAQGLVAAGVVALAGVPHRRGRSTCWSPACWSSSARRRSSKVGPPERTIRTSKETAAFLKSPLSAQWHDADDLTSRLTPRSPASPARGTTRWSPRTAPASMWPSPVTARWCCCCTASRSSGGPGGTSCRRSPTAGYRAAAMDLRGYGASDKPPRGYDPRTLGRGRRRA